MADNPVIGRRENVSTGLRWFSRIMSWLCWVGIVATVVFGLLTTFGILKGSDTPADPGALIAYSSISLGAHDPSTPRPPLPDELLHDPFYMMARFLPTLLIVWALLSARRVFANIGAGDFFARKTATGLRNLSLAVLLNMTVAPLIIMASHVAFGMRMKAQGRHGELYLDFGLSNTTLLVLIFAATVAIIASVMAHAARVAEENEQFV